MSLVPVAFTTKVAGGDVDGVKIIGSAGVNTAVNWYDPTVNVDVVVSAVPETGVLLVTGTGAADVDVPVLELYGARRPAHRYRSEPRLDLDLRLSVTALPASTGEAGDVVSVVVVSLGPVFGVGVGFGEAVVTYDVGVVKVIVDL